MDPQDRPLDALDQLLDDLARQSDDHHRGDRVPAVRARARRTARRRRAASVAALSVAVCAVAVVSRLVAGGGTSTVVPISPPALTSPATTVPSSPPASTGRPGPSSPPPTGPGPSASSTAPSTTPSTTVPAPNTAAARPVDWRNRAYPVDCGTVTGTLTFVGAEATSNGFHLTAVPASYDVVTTDTGIRMRVEAVTIRCVGAGSFPDTVLIYRQDGVLLGTPVRASENTNVTSFQVSGTTMTITARGWSATAPHSSPDLTVIREVTFHGGGISVNRRTVPLTSSPATPS